jgi:hypothetical protein
MAQSQPPSTATFPLPVATTQTARSLIRLHQYLRGELLKREDSEDLLVAHEECRRMMAAIETLLPFLRVNFDPSALKARRAYPKVGPLEYGQIRSGALASLKRAGSWRTYNQVLDDIVTTRRLHLTQRERKHMLQKLREALHALKGAGAVVCERPGARLGDNSFEQRWQLSSMFG